MHITPQKKLGQNFIINVPKEILIPEITSNKHLLLIEIGPGTGNITYKVLQNLKQLIEEKQIKSAEFYLIELDSRLLPYLHKLAKNYSNDKLHVHILNQDVLTIDLLNITVPYGQTALFIFGALPYNISKRIIQWSILQALRLKDTHQSITFLPFRFIIQLEVAQRYLGQKNKKDFLYWSIAPILCYANVTKKLPPGNFVPSPKVTSAILEFLLCPKKLQNLFNLNLSYEKLWQKWNEIAQKIKMFYQNRRKTLIATNKKLKIVPNNAIPKKIGNKRPEDLTLTEWIRLFDIGASPRG